MRTSFDCAVTVVWILAISLVRNASRSFLVLKRFLRSCREYTAASWASAVASLRAHRGRSQRREDGVQSRVSGPPPPSACARSRAGNDTAHVLVRELGLVLLQLVVRRDGDGL